MPVIAQRNQQFFQRDFQEAAKPLVIALYAGVHNPAAYLGVCSSFFWHAANDAIGTQLDTGLSVAEAKASCSGGGISPKIRPVRLISHVVPATKDCHVRFI